MTLTEAQRIFPTIFLKQLNSILINGNLGDFVTAQDGLEIVRYFREQNPRLKITINTNAGARPGIWTELAKLNVEILFCIDGLKNTHELYRRQTNWETVINHAQLFIQSGGNATWKMILFDHNQHEIEQCKKLSQDLGFKRFEVIDHGRNAFPVFDQKKNYLYSIGQHTLPVNFDELHNNYKNKVGGSNPSDITQIQCQVKKEKSIYITATGEVYPCCWLGFYPRTLQRMNNNQIVPLLPNNNNANQLGIESVIQWFDLVADAWATDPLTQCKINCGIKTDNQSQCDKSDASSLQ